MIIAGIDVGAKNVHAVLIKDGELVARATVLSGFDQEESAERGLAEAAAAAGVGRADIDRVAATGAGRKALPFATQQPTEVAADGRGAFDLYPGARTVIDVGADEARAIRLGAGGKVVDFAINEKCAAGAGAFVEAMSRALDMKLDDFAKASLDSTADHPHERPVHGVRRIGGGEPHPRQYASRRHRPGGARRHGQPGLGHGAAHRHRGPGGAGRRGRSRTSGSSNPCPKRWAGWTSTSWPMPNTWARTAPRSSPGRRRSRGRRPPPRKLLSAGPLRVIPTRPSSQISAPWPEHDISVRARPQSLPT